MIHAHLRMRVAGMPPGDIHRIDERFAAVLTVDDDHLTTPVGKRIRRQIQPVLRYAHMPVRKA